MQILSTRSKVSSRRFYESFTFNKRYKSYIRDRSGEATTIAVILAASGLCQDRSMLLLGF
jgi:hypothetical protein